MILLIEHKIHCKMSPHSLYLPIYIVQIASYDYSEEKNCGTQKGKKTFYLTIHTFLLRIVKYNLGIERKKSEV